MSSIKRMPSDTKLKSGGMKFRTKVKDKKKEGLGFLNSQYNDFSARLLTIDLWLNWKLNFGLVEDIQC